MKLTEVFSQIKVLLSGIEEEKSVELEETTEIEVKFETQMLIDGVTTIEAETFEPGSAIFIVVPESDPVPLPIGEYELGDGRMLVVEEEGIILSIGEAPEEEEVEEPELESTTGLEELTQKVLDLEQVIEDLKSKLQLSETSIEEVNASLVEKDTKIDELNLELSKLPAAKKVGTLPKYIETKFSKTPQENTSKLSTFDKICQSIGESNNK